MFSFPCQFRGVCDSNTRASWGSLVFFKHLDVSRVFCTRSKSTTMTFRFVGRVISIFLTLITSLHDWLVIFLTSLTPEWNFFMILDFPDVSIFEIEQGVENCGREFRFYESSWKVPNAGKFEFAPTSLACCFIVFLHEARSKRNFKESGEHLSEKITQRMHILYEHFCSM